MTSQKREVSSYRTEGNELRLHLLLPQLQQEAAVLLVKGAGVRQEAAGQEDVAHQVFDLRLEPGAAVRPADLRHHEGRWRMRGWMYDG